jgi:hypothetical protein
MICFIRISCDEFCLAVKREIIHFGGLLSAFIPRDEKCILQVSGFSAAAGLESGQSDQKGNIGLMQQ